MKVFSLESFWFQYGTTFRHTHSTFWSLFNDWLQNFGRKYKRRDCDYKCRHSKSLITVVMYFIWNNNNTPENYQMREVSSLSLTSGHDDSHPGGVLAEERSAMVLNPAMVWSINSYLGYRHCHKELLLFYLLFCTGIQGEDRVSRIWWVVNAATTLHLEHWHWPRLHFLYTRTCRIHRFKKKMIKGYLWTSKQYQN